MALKGTISHFRDVVVVVGVILLPLLPSSVKRQQPSQRRIESVKERSETPKYRNENQSQRQDETTMRDWDGREGGREGGRAGRIETAAAVDG